MHSWNPLGNLPTSFHPCIAGHPSARRAFSDGDAPVEGVSVFGAFSFLGRHRRNNIYFIPMAPSTFLRKCLGWIQRDQSGFWAFESQPLRRLHPRGFNLQLSRRKVDPKPTPINLMDLLGTSQALHAAVIPHRNARTTTTVMSNHMDPPGHQVTTFSRISEPAKRVKQKEPYKITIHRVFIPLVKLLSYTQINHIRKRTGNLMQPTCENLRDPPLDLHLF